MSKHKLIFVISALSLLIATAVSAQLFSSTPKPSSSLPSGPTVTPMTSDDFSKQVQGKISDNKSTLNQTYQNQMSALPQPKLSGSNLPQPPTGTDNRSAQPQNGVIPAAGGTDTNTGANAQPTQTAPQQYTPPTPPPPTNANATPQPAPPPVQAQPYTGFSTGKQQPASSTPPANNSGSSGGWNIKY